MKYKRITPNWLAKARRWGLEVVLEYLREVKYASVISVNSACGTILTPRRLKSLVERGIISKTGWQDKFLSLGDRGWEILKKKKERYE